MKDEVLELERSKRKGDANLDFIISITLFLSFLVFILSALNQILPNALPSAEGMNYQNLVTSNLLLMEFQLDGKPGVLNHTKLDNITNCSQLDLGLDLDFYYEIKTRNKFWACNPEININKALPVIERPVYVRLKNGRETPGKMRVWSWPKVT